MAQTYSPRSITVSDLWFGNQMSRSARQQLARRDGESSYDYFSRWAAIKGCRLEWKVTTFPYAQPGQRKLYRPILNGSLLAPCYCGQGETDAAAKEASCKSLVDAIGCKL